MITMSHSATIGAEAHAEPKARVRNLSLDRARTFLTLVVLLHHAVIPYTYFGHTDPTSWIGFDIVVLATDSFFMAMFFFLSGLFTWPGIARKAPQVFLRDRLLRLGLPFMIAAFTVIPLAYYAIALRENPELTFASFWWMTVTKGPWPSGPIWFVWVLLAFDLTASLLYRVSAHLVDPANRVSLRGFNRPAAFWLMLVVISAIAYVPMLVYFGANKWFEFGPFSVQASRVLLYFTYFFIGASVGAANFDHGILGAEGQLPRKRWLWVSVTLIPYCLMWGMIYIKREILDNPDHLPHWYHMFYGTFLVLFSASILLAILAFFLHSKMPGPTLLDRMQADAYGMFLVHYPIALWIQYVLFDYGLPAIVKAAIGFMLTVLLSWGVTAALRKIPGASHVL
ncbi:acyltransferase [Bradyrhizobium sp. GCM10027634]|uniref:acyltransferase family protein n=1 Tax=unclassified Bradyrhizobium TaxID=2631580 RepID=UPI00188B3384|nr:MULTISPECIES: acyltransferase [unclassified Bradyrhizobium]MDN5002211.1 acyltransferase [Bradyrhizobium sp. WYCCWR 12677]QOZ44277.1 acyltransferase [Bradyrhizobium sp. CCBAU 53340]